MIKSTDYTETILWRCVRFLSNWCYCMLNSVKEAVSCRVACSAAMMGPQDADDSHFLAFNGLVETTKASLQGQAAVQIVDITLHRNTFALATRSFQEYCCTVWSHGNRTQCDCFDHNLLWPRHQYDRGQKSIVDELSSTQVLAAVLYLCMLCTVGSNDKVAGDIWRLPHFQCYTIQMACRGEWGLQLCYCGCSWNYVCGWNGKRTLCQSSKMPRLHLWISTAGSEWALPASIARKYFTGEIHWSISFFSEGPEPVHHAYKEIEAGCWAVPSGFRTELPPKCPETCETDSADLATAVKCYWQLFKPDCRFEFGRTILGVLCHRAWCQSQNHLRQRRS